MTDIPNADSFESALKKGNLLKLIGKGWLFPGTWKQRHCVLHGTMLYCYESENSRGGDRTTGCINLEAYEVCEEMEDKKYPFAFYIGTSTRGFFDNRHHLAAQTKDDMQDWIRSVQDVLSESKISRNRIGKTKKDIYPSEVNNGKNNDSVDINVEVADETDEEKDDDESVTRRLVSATKDRVRGPQGRKLPQRISCVPKQVSDEDERKQKSLSVYSPISEGPEEEQSDESRKRISSSLEEMDHNTSDEMMEGNGQRCISSDDITCRLNSEQTSNNSNLVRKAGFGKLGSQQVALAKELELKFKKTALPPGGLRFPKHKSTSRQTPDDEALVKMIESLDNRIHTMLNSVDEILEPKIEELKSNSKNSTIEWSQLTKAKDLLKQASTTLKKAEEINSESKQVLEQAKKARDEYQKLQKELEDTIPQSNRLSTPPSGT